MSVYQFVVVQGDKPYKRGTAWQLGADLLVTAFHVVGENLEDKWLHEAVPGATYHVIGAGPASDDPLDPVDHDSKADIAVLRSRKPLPGQPLEPSEVEAVDEARWRADGFPKVTDEKVFRLTGTVAAVRANGAADDLQLTVDLHTSVSWEGASGSAVCVGGRVVGILTEELNQLGSLKAARTTSLRRLLERQGLGALMLQGLRISSDDLDSHWNPKSRGVEAMRLSGSYFTGRTAVLRQLVGWLTGNDDDRRMRVVTGRPGSGKSAILARLVMQSLRSDNAGQGEEGTVLPPGLIDVAIHAQGKNLKQVVTQIASDLGLQGDSENRLLSALKQKKRRVVLLLDALNEALKPDDIADLLDKMAYGLGNVKVIVGTRSTGLQGLLPSACVVIDLDDPTYHLRSDVADYVNRRLSQEPQSPYKGDSGLARRIAESVADHAGTSFLVAQVISRLLTQQPSGSNPEAWRELITGDLDVAFAKDLERFGTRRHKVRDLLEPLAYAEGRGLPWENLWAKLATAISGKKYTDSHIRWLREKARYYIVEDREDDGLVYRLYHQEFARYLQDSHRKRDIQKRITKTLIAEISTNDGTKDWIRASHYIRTHIAAHAAAAEDLDHLLSDRLYLITAEPAPLLRALSKQKKIADDEAARVYAMAYHELERASLSDRASYLELTARRIGASHFADSLKSIPIPRPWTVPWAYCSPTKEHRTLKGHNGPVRALATIRLESGPAILSASDDGTIRMWELHSGIAIGKPLDGHKGAIRALAATMVEDRPVAISAGVDETIRVWDLNSQQQSSHPFRGHKGAVNALTIVKVHDSPLVVSGGDDGTVRVWDLRRESSIETLFGHRGAVHALVSGKMGGQSVVVSAGEDSFLRVWDPANHTLLFEIPSLSNDLMRYFESRSHELNQKTAELAELHKSRGIQDNFFTRLTESNILYLVASGHRV